MKNITITKENLQKAYDEGCDDTKKVLKNLCPDEFEKEMEIEKGKINACLLDRNVIYIEIQRSKYRAVELKTDESYNNGWHDIDGFKNHWGNMEWQSFDNQKDFLEWALKAIK